LSNEKRTKNSWFDYCFFPILVAALGGVLAFVAGCESEGGAYKAPCYFLGSEVAGLINGMTLFHWFGIVTLPIGLGLIAIGSLFKKKTVEESTGVQLDAQSKSWLPTVADKIFRWIIIGFLCYISLTIILGMI
jgi:hypothetical protein